MGNSGGTAATTATGGSAGTPDGDAPDAGDAGALSYSDACAAVEGARFVSQNQLRLSDAVDGGIAYGHWGLTFKPGASFCWQHDDVLCDAGTYVCNGFDLTATLAGLTVRASYEPATDTLTWAGEPYTRQ